MNHRCRLRTIGTTEIKRMPGGNRDISKVVRALPGVALNAHPSEMILLSAEELHQKILFTSMAFRFLSSTTFKHKVLPADLSA